MWKSFFAGMSRMSRTQKTCLILISPSRRYGFNSDSAQRIIGDHNATAQELSTFTLGLQWCSALWDQTERDLELGVKGMQLVRLWVGWCDYIVFGSWPVMACHVSSRITGVEVREVGFFLNFWAQPTPESKHAAEAAPLTNWGTYYHLWWRTARRLFLRCLVDQVTIMGLAERLGKTLILALSSPGKFKKNGGNPHCNDTDLSHISPMWWIWWPRIDRNPPLMWWQNAIPSVNRCNSRIVYVIAGP